MWLSLKNITILGAVAVLVLANQGNCDPTLKRQRRALQYPHNSCTGVLVAMAIPLNLEHRNVFVSFNFEANYNMPTTAPDIIPGPLKRLEYLVEEEDRSFKGNSSYHVNAIERQETPSLFSRVKIYQLIESKISGLKLNGRKCLLRLICEVAESKKSLQHNGVLGDLINILLTPSSTPSEGTPQYSKAEISGTKGECAPYRLGCTVNLLNYFTSML